MPRLCGFDLIRCVAIFCVMVYHFRSGSVGIFPERWNFNGFTLGSLGVSMFFILSGAALRYSDEGRYSLARFARSRFLSLFPLFWIAFAAAHWAYWLWFGDFGPFAGIPVWRLVFSVLAVDGWVSFHWPNFCVVGEWFLGCILVVYCAYPLLRRMIERWPLRVLAVYLVLVVALSHDYRLVVPPFTNPFFRGFEFACGIAFSRWILLAAPSRQKTLMCRTVLGAAAFLMLGLYASFHPKAATAYLSIFSLGIVGFLILWLVGSRMCDERIKRLLSVAGRYSFSAFLCHHVIAGMLLSSYLAHGRVTCLRTLFYFASYLIMVALASILLEPIGRWLSAVLKHFLFERSETCDAHETRNGCRT